MHPIYTPGTAPNAHATKAIATDPRLAPLTQVTGFASHLPIAINLLYGRRI